MTLADRLTELLEQHHHTLRDAERNTGLGYATIHDIKSGKSQNPERNTLERIAEAYGVGVDWLLGAEPSAPPSPSAPPTHTPDGLPPLDMTEVWARIDRVNADPSLSEPFRLVKVEQLLAAGRLQQQYEETRAAAVRTRVIDREIGLAESRTRAVEREAEYADRRLSLYEAEAPTPTEGGDEGKALREAKRATGLAARQKRKRGGGGGRRAGGS